VKHIIIGIILLFDLDNTAGRFIYLVGNLLLHFETNIYLLLFKFKKSNPFAYIYVLCINFFNEPCCSYTSIKVPYFGNEGTSKVLF